MLNAKVVEGECYKYDVVESKVVGLKCVGFILDKYILKGPSKKDLCRRAKKVFLVYIYYILR